jgi:hypothetical protein
MGQDDPNPQTAIDTFSSEFGLSQTTLTVLYPHGASTPEQGLEGDLDVQSVHSVAPGAQIVLVHDDDFFSAIDYVATNHVAPIVSNSWVIGVTADFCDTGFSQSDIAALDQRLALDTAQGLTILFASGDWGARPDGVHFCTHFPASDPNVLSVGGTDLTLAGCGTFTCTGYGSEDGWSGSGGGYSGALAEPTWQSSTIGTKPGRAVPDVSMLGGNPGVYVYHSQLGWRGVTGTSLSTPLWAGFLAIVLQMKGGGSFGNLGPVLYQIASSSSYSSIFHDIASGSNGYSAGPGWDPVTGWGTPVADLLADALAGLRIALVAPANGATVTTSPVTFQVQVTDSTGVPIQGALGGITVNHLSEFFACGISGSDSNGYFSCDFTFTNGGTYSWYATASKMGYVPATSQTWTFNYFVQVTMTVSYSVPGAGTGYSDPLFIYVHDGQSNTYTLTATSTGISVDSGSAWSVTSNPLAGSTPSERWYSSQTLSGTASTTVIVFTFYHQYLQTLLYAVSGGGSGYSAPIFTANRYGASAPQTLTSTATGYWYDASSPWSVTPNPLSGSGASDRWITTQTTSGTISSGQTITFTYQHQYYLTTQVNPSGGGSVSVPSGWENAGITVPVTATPNTDYAFYYWSLDGTNVGNNPSLSVAMNSAHGLTAFFLGSSAISLGVSSGSIDLGSLVILSGAITPTQPAGMTVFLSYSLDGSTWNTFIVTRTDGSGAYSIAWCPPYPNTYQIRASWSGNAAYAGSTSSASSLSVTGTLPPKVTLLVTGPPSAIRGSTASFDVLVTNPGDFLMTTLYIEVIGPGGYEYFDTLQVSVAAGSTGRFQFTWQAASASGSYQALVGLIPPKPTSISQAQITVT